MRIIGTEKYNANKEPYNYPAALKFGWDLHREGAKFSHHWLTIYGYDRDVDFTVHPTGGGRGAHILLELHGDDWDSLMVAGVLENEAECAMMNFMVKLMNQRIESVDEFAQGGCVEMLGQALGEVVSEHFE